MKRENENLITYKEAHTLLDYDPETGLFRWKITRRGVPIGKIVGNLQKPEPGRRAQPRVRIFVLGKSYMAHRLAWFMVHGVWPILEIDHKDGDSSNNALSNLREASSSDNKHNRSRPHNNTSGATSVQFIKRLNKWCAVVCIGKEHYSLGCYSSFDEAVEARDSFCRVAHDKFFKGATC